LNLPRDLGSCTLYLFRVVFSLVDASGRHPLSMDTTTFALVFDPPRVGRRVDPLLRMSFPYRWLSSDQCPPDPSFRLFFFFYFSHPVGRFLNGSSKSLIPIAFPPRSKVCPPCFLYTNFLSTLSWSFPPRVRLCSRRGIFCNTFAPTCALNIFCSLPGLGG